MRTESVEWRIAHFANNNLKVFGVNSIKVSGTAITLKDLADDEAKWAGCALLPGCVDIDTSPDPELVRKLIYELMPFEIRASRNNGVGTDLAADINRYEVLNRGQKQTFGLRLRPTNGVIETIKLRETRSVAINKLSITERGLSVDLGNGPLHAEICFRPEEPSPISGYTGIRVKTYP